MTSLILIFALWFSAPCEAFLRTTSRPRTRQVFYSSPPRTSIESLEKLLERQKEELKETEQLLKRLRKEKDAAKRTNAAAIVGVDYGFQSRSEGVPAKSITGRISETYGPPSNIWRLGTQQFMRNLRAMKGEYEDEVDLTLTPQQVILQAKLEALTLNSTAIWEREEANGPVSAPLIIKIPYLVLCYFLDTVFEGKYVFARFLFLETVARMPYFSYINMLHLYETLGFWRRSPEVKRIHFAEENNEFHHLMIMESLGGDQAWWTRFLAQHSAIAYFFVLEILWMISPSLSYKFSELLETHAVNTYSQLLDENESILKELPPPFAAIEYYAFGASDPMYAEIQTDAISKGEKLRRPGDSMKSLYDVFQAIRDDEGDHVSTMEACLNSESALRAPSTERKILYGLAMAATLGYALTIPEGADMTRVEQLLNSFGDISAGEGVLDAATAGVAGIVSQIAGADEEEVAKEAAELMETGVGLAVMEGLRDSLITFARALAAFIASVL